MLLKSKVVIITGGAGLLGQEFVKSVALNGGICIIGDIDEDSGKAAVEKIKADINKNNVDFIKLDITSKESIENSINFLKGKYGKIDALVNNAYPRNKNYGRKFEDVEFKDFCQNVNLHLGGYFLMTQQYLEFFKQQGFGNIVNISSIYGITAPRFEIYENTEMTMPVEYSVIKSGINHLTKYTAKYYKNMNIRVNTLSLGGIIDKQPESFVTRYKEYSLNKGMLERSDVTGTLVFLLNDSSTYINGQNIIVDDGWSL